MLPRATAAEVFRRDLFEGTNVVVTGGGTGLGLGFATAFARHGASVVVTSRKKENLQRAVAEITAARGKAIAIECDVRDPASVEAMIASTVSQLGSVDVLVNNASALFMAPSEKLSPGGWRAVIETALDGTFYCSSAAARSMIRQKSPGVIIDIIAPNAWTGAPYHAHNGAAKAGIAGLIATLSLEWAKYGIRVNGIAPGPVDTEGGGGVLWSKEGLREAVRESIPAKRFGSREEIAAAALYLASPAAAYVTGDTLVIDGGQQYHWLAWSREELVGRSIHEEFDRRAKDKAGKGQG